MKQPPETIYLIPGEDIDGQLGWLWCDDPAPSHDHDPAEAVKYIRADVHQEIIDRQARAATMGMNAAKKSAEIMERNARRLLAESNPEAIESERAANAMLTQDLDQAQARMAELEKCLSVAHQILNDQGATGSIMGRFRKALAGDAEQTGGES